jgi:hypothetical protein
MLVKIELFCIILHTVIDVTYTEFGFEYLDDHCRCPRTILYIRKTGCCLNINESSNPFVEFNTMNGHFKYFLGAATHYANAISRNNLLKKKKVKLSL